MKKALYAVLIGVMLSMTATQLWAETVCVTQKGKKFHPADSRFCSRDGVEKISVEEAKARGLEPSKEYLKVMDGQGKETAKKK